MRSPEFPDPPAFPYLAETWAVAVYLIYRHDSDHLPTQGFNMPICQTTRLLVSIIPQTDNYCMIFDYKYNALFNVWSTRDPEEGRKGQNADKRVLFVYLSIIRSILQ